MGVVWAGGEVLGAFRDFRCVVVMAFWTHEGFRVGTGDFEECRGFKWV